MQFALDIIENYYNNKNIGGMALKFRFEYIFIIFLFTSCPFKEGNQFIIRVNEKNTEIVIINNKKDDLFIKQFPRHPGLVKASDRFILRYNNGNGIVLVPDITETKEIKAWNDFSVKFNLIFVNVKGKKMDTILADEGKNIRINKISDLKECFVFQINEKKCNLIILNDKGVIIKNLNYSYKSYPDYITIDKDNNQYIIIHNNIEDSEIFLFDKNKNIINSIEYTNNENKEC
jgi:hypothetical protein